MASVEVIQGPDKGRIFRLGNDDTIIGRQSEAVPLSDGTVSRQHARFSAQDGAWHIEDVGSVNGTFVNGIRAGHPTRLHLGDQIRIGRTLLVFSAGDGAAPRMDVDENGRLVEASIMATVPASDESIVIPTLEAGAEAIGSVRILYELATELSSIFSLDRLLHRTLERVLNVVKADRAYILLVGPNGKLTPKATHNSTHPDDQTDVPISRTIINEVVTKHVGVLCSNAMRDKRFSSGKSVHEYGIRSAIVAPIKGREKVLGVIHVDSSVSEHTYTTEQLRLLTAIGYQTGLAVENVRLYEAQVAGERLAAVGETVALLSHHIKNIIQGLSAGSELVENALAQQDADKASRSWPIIRRSLDRINAVVLNMLAFSKQRRPLLESVNVNLVLGECVDLLMPQADERSVAIMTDLADMPPVPADADALHQAVLNLLTNALEAVPDNAGVVTVSSKFDTLDQQAVIGVADNGVGIEPEQIDHIFDIFHSTKGQKATGLGLAVVKKVVEEHGAVIDVDSAPGRGTTFTIRLPIRPGRSDDTTAP